MPKEIKLVDIEISSMTQSGEGLFYLDKKPFFINNALPGECIQANITYEAKNYGRASPKSFLTISPDRIQPPCKHFESCGGCQIMHLNSKAQLTYKRQIVIDAISRYSSLQNAFVEDCVQSPNYLFYRNKIIIPIKAEKDNPLKLFLGLYAARSNTIIPIESCLIHNQSGEQVFLFFKNYIDNECDLSEIDKRKLFSALRYLMIRSSVKMNQMLVVFVVEKDVSSLCKSIVDLLMKAFPEIKGVLLNINPGISNNILSNTYQLLSGQESIQEEINGLFFEVSAASFLQINPLQAQQLYLKAIDLADIKSHEILLDAYCGTGTLTLQLARKAKHVVGIEIVQQAIENANNNAQRNAINNVTFLCSAAEKVQNNLDRFDTVFLNPPRKGCERSFLEEIVSKKPKKIIYISCNPISLARDLSILTSLGYIVKSLHPFDMFPQTTHVETIAYLERVIDS